MSVTIAMFTDYACPWCYLGRARLVRAAEQVPLRIAPVHFPLAADTPPEGRPIRPYLAAKGIDVDQAVETLRTLLEDEGLPYLTDVDTARSWPTRRAQILAVWAQTQPQGDAIHDVLFHAYHVDQRNVGDTEVLVELAGRAGLDTAEARIALEDPRWADEVDRHWALAARIGVSSVPTFVAGGQGVVGAQEVATLVGLAQRAQG